MSALNWFFYRYYKSGEFVNFADRVVCKKESIERIKVMYALPVWPILFVCMWQSKPRCTVCWPTGCMTGPVSQRKLRECVTGTGSNSVLACFFTIAIHNRIAPQNFAHYEKTTSNPTVRKRKFIGFLLDNIFGKWLPVLAELKYSSSTCAKESKQNGVWESWVKFAIN